MRPASRLHREGTHLQHTPCKLAISSSGSANASAWLQDCDELRNNLPGHSACAWHLCFSACFSSCSQSCKLHIALYLRHIHDQISNKPQDRRSSCAMWDRKHNVPEAARQHNHCSGPDPNQFLRLEAHIFKMIPKRLKKVALTATRLRLLPPFRGPEAPPVLSNARTFCSAAALRSSKRTRLAPAVPPTMRAICRMSDERCSFLSSHWQVMLRLGIPEQQLADLFGQRTKLPRTWTCWQITQKNVGIRDVQVTTLSCSVRGLHADQHKQLDRLAAHVYSLDLQLVCFGKARQQETMARIALVCSL